MPYRQDQAGTWWEVDAQGNPVRPANGPRATTIGSPSASKQAEERRADDRISMERQRLQMEQQRFQNEQRQNEPAMAPGDTTKTGEDYLATLPRALAAQVRMLSEGRMAMPTGAGQRSAAARELVAAAAQYDPTMDAANVATRIATRKDFTSGKSAQNITALNTALGHIGSLWQASQALGNRTIPAWNGIANWAESQGGDPRVNNFNMARNAVVDELTRVFRGTGGSESDIQAWKDNINSSQSPEQLRASVGKAVELLNSRLESLGAQYNRGMSRSDQPISLLAPHAQSVFNALKEGGNGIVGQDDNKTPPMIGGGNPASPPSSPSNPPASPLNSPDPSYGLGAATGAMRDVYDPQTAAGMNSLVRSGRPYEEALAYAKAQGMAGLDPKAYAANVAYAKQHPDYKGGFTYAHKQVPTTLRERISASAPAAAVSGAATALSGGYNDELMAGLQSALTGQDYTQVRNDLNARKNILAETHPVADIAGNVAGGVTAGLAGGALAARAGLTGALGEFAPVAGDVAYGGIYGSGQNNEDRLGGAAIGGITGGAGGALTRGLTRGAANVIAPPAGPAAPLYEAGVFPTPGQRFSQSGMFGRALNTAEQAMQSVPILGTGVARSRQTARDAFQRGGFNQALGDIGERLPLDINPGTGAQDFTTNAFGGAYNRARSGMQFVPDQQYLSDLAQFQQRLGNGVLNPTQAEQVGRVISNSVGGRLDPTIGALSGEAYQRAGTELGDAASTWGKDSTTAPMADALSDYTTIFDNAARRNSDPMAVQLLDNADRGYAKFVRLRNAAARGGVRKEAGTFSPTDLLAAVKQEGGGVKSSAYNRGNALMQDYAQAGGLLTDTLPNSGTAERLMTGQALTGALGAATHAPGMVAANPASLAPFALYAPGIEKYTKRMFAGRQYTLPPELSTPIIDFASQVYNRAPVVSRIATPILIDREVNP